MKQLSRRHWLEVVLVGAVTGLFAAGCDYGNNHDYDHNPPAGQGSIIVDNHTSDDIAVFIDGVRVADARDGHSRTYDLAPGVPRGGNEKGGDRTFRGDVDVIEGRVTVLDVRFDSFDSSAFDVAIFFD